VTPDPTADASAQYRSIATAFVDGLRAGQLRWQGCDACGAPQHVARHACVGCGSPRLSWRLARGDGVVWSATVVTRAPSPAFQALAPYTVVLVDLVEGARVMGHAQPGITIGEPVTARIIAGPLRPLLHFEPLRPVREGTTVDALPEGARS
jgi:uncharacterized OB-fold protein